MKKTNSKGEIPVFVGVLAVIVLIIGAIAYFIFVYPSGTSKSEALPLNSEEILDKNTETKETEPEALVNEVLLKQDFSINMPSGWEEVTTSEAIAFVLNTKEEITDQKAQEIGFISYFSINNDSLKEYTFEEYIEEVKVNLIQVIEDIDFTDKTEGKINGFRTIYVEAESFQQEINFKTLLVFIKGEDDIVWAVSFNTIKDKWPEYKDLFYQTAQSFKLELN